MQGAGNDFIIIDNMDGAASEAELSRMAAKLCTRHTSIGADGLMAVIRPQNGGDYGMRYFNSDGSAGEMCGNGARCIARYGYENGLAGETQRIETIAGMVTGRRLGEEDYQVRLNDPSLIERAKPVYAGGVEYDCDYVELGNPGIPHAVILAPDFEKVDRQSLRRFAMELRYSSVFPKGANINFVELKGKDRLRIMTYERGVEDFTMACGTGCASAAAALTLSGAVSGKNVKLENTGGTLTVSLTREGDRIYDIYLSGPAVMVCRGETCGKI